MRRNNLKKINKAAELPCSPGIYQTRCIANGKIYVGGTVNLRNRWGYHRRRLRQGKHHNAYLQSAWNLYGEASFEFLILDLADKHNLLLAEQTWLDKTGCSNREIGFNVFSIAGSPSDMFAQVWEGFIDPNGNEVTSSNLFDFCREHVLDFPSMHRLAKGRSKLKSYKGWSHINSVRQRDYVKTYEGFIDPSGQPICPITNLAKFCQEHGLEKSHMVAVAHGRLCSHQGWTYYNGKQRTQKVYKGYVAPNGQAVTITNLAACCKEQGLHPVHMHQLKNGQRKSHKGWTWRMLDE